MIQNIYEEIVELRRRGARAALATIVARKGSTPRKDAAKMLVYEDGRQLGTIGGGCNEAEVIKEALIAIRSEKPTFLHFDLTDEDADESALLCGGTMEVYVEPILADPTLIIFGGGMLARQLPRLPACSDSELPSRMIASNTQIQSDFRMRLPFTWIPGMRSSKSCR